MNIFIDFENALLNNDIDLELRLIALRKYCRMCYKDKVMLSTLPYDSQALSILSENYNEHTNTLHILHKEQNSHYANMASELLKEELKCQIKTLAINGDKLSTIKNIGEDFVYIGGCVYDYKIYQQAKESSIIGNLFAYLVHLVISKHNKNSRNNFLSGFFSLFFTHFHLILPTIAIWPSWIEVNGEIINLIKIKALFIASLGFFSAASIIRTLLSINREREFFMNNKEILCGEEFILYNNRIEMAMLWIILFSLFGFYGLFLNILGGLTGLFFATVYFIFYLSEFKRKWIYMLSLIIITNFIINPIFALKFFKIL